MRARLLGCVLSLCVAGCISPIDPASVPVALVRVTIGDRNLQVDTLQVRSIQHVHAAAIATEGYEVAVSQFIYSSSNPGVATVDSLGTVRAIGLGTATITVAIRNGKSGSATVVVVPSTIAYTIPIGSVPGAIAFSPDYTKAYVVAGANADSLVFLDALGFLRVQSIPLGAATYGLASTTATVFATHPAEDSVSLISAATKTLERRISVGRGPRGVAATATDAFIAVQLDQKIVTVHNDGSTVSLPLGGQPRDLAVAAATGRLFATVDLGGGSWEIVSIDATNQSVLHSIALPGAPLSIAASSDGQHVYALIPSQSAVVMIAVGAAGDMTIQATVPAPSTGPASGIGVRSTGDAPYVVVAGSPLTIYNASTLARQDQVAGAGSGSVAVRPDGLFVFVGSPEDHSIHVIGL